MFGREGNSKELLGEGGGKTWRSLTLKTKTQKTFKKKKGKICDWLVDKYQCVLAHVTAQACSFWYVCARVFMRIRVHPPLSLCVCLRPTLLPLHPDSQKAALLTVYGLAGRPSAAFFVFCFGLDFFNYKNTQAWGATATPPTPLDCTESECFLTISTGSSFPLAHQPECEVL